MSSKNIYNGQLTTMKPHIIRDINRLIVKKLTEETYHIIAILNTYLVRSSIPRIEFKALVLRKTGSLIVQLHKEIMISRTYFLSPTHLLIVSKIGYFKAK